MSFVFVACAYAMYAQVKFGLITPVYIHLISLGLEIFKNINVLCSKRATDF